ncbi:hypothetical protein MNBD_ALPHA01-1125, partial [hydrothermal vent metagenome]
MADNNQNKATDKDSDIELDPALQGVDRVHQKQQDDARLNAASEETTEDTQTRANIHLGGRTDESEDPVSEAGQTYPSSSVEDAQVSGSPVHTNI